MNPEDYKQWIAELKNRVRSAQIKAAVSVNSELTNLYWSIGQDIVERKVEDALGGNFYKRISQDLQSEFPNVKGFSERNIYYMRAMYVLFSPMAYKLPQAVAPDIRKTLSRQSAFDRTLCADIHEYRCLHSAVRCRELTAPGSLILFN